MSPTFLGEIKKIDKICLGFYISTCCITSKKKIVTGTEAEPGKQKGSNRISSKELRDTN